MILIPGVEKQKIAVYGLGATGLSVCAALVASGADVYCFDENESARAQTANTKHAASHPKDWPWAELRTLVLSPGVPLTHPKPHVIVRKARQEKVEVIGDIELFARALDAFDAKVRPRVIGVTGSNGKSTATALIGHILKEVGQETYIGGNIGVPLLSLPAPRGRATYVVELSSFQLDLAMSFRPDIAILLNLSPDHLDRHGTMERYIDAKKRIFAHQGRDGLAIVGVDDKYTQRVCAELSAADVQSVVPVSAGGALGRGVFALDGKLFYRLGDKTGEAGDISKVAAMRGAHNWQNGCAALAAVLTEGVAASVAIRAMERFRGLPHRLELAAHRGKVQFVNDSKATNLEAAKTALQAYDDTFWIAGGRPKDGGFKDLKPFMDGVRAIYVIGEAEKQIEADLAGAAPIIRCGDLKTAVARAARDAEASEVKEPVVLLSPACASHDQFKNFEARGDAFKQYAQEIESIGGAAA